MSALARVQVWWRARDARERTMLTVMLILVGAFVYWYGLLWPLRSVRVTTQAHYDRAVETLRAVESDAAAIRVRQADLPPMPTGDALARRVLDSAKVAAVPVSRQRSDAQGDFSVDIDRVAAPALFAWLDALRRDHGIAPAALRITRADGLLRAEAVFDTETP